MTSYSDRLVFKTIIQPRRHKAIPAFGLLMLLPKVRRCDLCFYYGSGMAHCVLMDPVLRSLLLLSFLSERWALGGVLLLFPSLRPFSSPLVCCFWSCKQALLYRWHCYCWCLSSSRMLFFLY